MTKKLSDDPDPNNKGKRSSDGKNKHALVVKVLIDMVHEAIGDSNPEAIQEGFDPAEWLNDWLTRPLPTLGGVTPSSLLGSPNGQALVTKALAQALEGVVS